MYLKRLKDLREDKDLRQREVASILNITRQQYGLYETGKRDIPAEFIKSLAIFYQTSTDYILELTNNIHSYTKSK